MAGRSIRLVSKPPTGPIASEARIVRSNFSSSGRAESARRSTCLLACMTSPTELTFGQELLKLLPIVAGAILAILGGAGTQFLIHRLGAERERRRVLREKGETLVKALHAHVDWRSIDNDGLRKRGPYCSKPTQRGLDDTTDLLPSFGRVTRASARLCETVDAMDC